jgi:hypothetical protein
MSVKITSCQLFRSNCEEESESLSVWYRVLKVY